MHKITTKSDILTKYYYKLVVLLYYVHKQEGARIASTHKTDGFVLQLHSKHTQGQDKNMKPEVWEKLRFHHQFYSLLT